MDLKKFLKENKEYHYNYVTPVTYKVSTGSFELDALMNGGYSPGIHRLGGASSGGKTSHALLVAKNFLKTVEGARVIYLKAEGRLSEKMKKRSGLEFTENDDEWKENPHKVFVYVCNIAESVANLIHTAVMDNSECLKYMFIVDSIDSLILEADAAKAAGSGEAVKVMGPQVLTKLLLKQVSNAISRQGHMLFLLAQVIAKMENKYEVKEQLIVGGAGGNAAIHFADYILQFMPRYKSDLITSDGKAVVTDASETNIVGHWCRVRVQKSDNETAGLEVHYPIKYGAVGDEVIWTEKEFEKSLYRYMLLRKESSRSHVLSETFISMLKEELGADAKIPESFDGVPKRDAYFSQPEIVKATKKILREITSDTEIAL